MVDLAGKHRVQGSLRGEKPHEQHCWSNNSAGHKQTGRFIEDIDDNFLTLVTEELMREKPLLELRHTNKQELPRDWRWGASFSAVDPKRKEQGKQQDHSPGLEERRLWPFRHLFRRTPKNTVLKRRRVYESWLIFLFFFQSSPSLVLRIVYPCMQKSKYSGWKT